MVHERMEGWTYPLVYLAVCGRDPRRLPALRELCLGRRTKAGRGAGAVAHGAVTALVELAQRRPNETPGRVAARFFQAWSRIG